MRVWRGKSLSARPARNRKWYRYARREVAAGRTYVNGYKLNPDLAHGSGFFRGAWWQ